MNSNVIDKMCYLRSDTKYHYFQKECENPKYVVENKNNTPDMTMYHTLKIIGLAQHPALNIGIDWSKKMFDPDLILCEIDPNGEEIGTFCVELTDPEFSDLISVLKDCLIQN